MRASTTIHGADKGRRACVVKRAAATGPGVIRAGIRRRCPAGSILPLPPPLPCLLFSPQCVYNGDDTSGLRLGASSRVTSARAPTRELFATRADYHHLPGTVFPPAGTYPSRHWRLDRMSSTRHSRYAADSRSSYLQLSLSLSRTLRAGAFQMHLCAHAPPDPPPLWQV